MAQGLDAAGFVDALRSRGVQLRIRNNRLWLQPARAYKELSDEEHSVLRRQRAEIKAIVAGLPAEAAPPSSAVPEPAPDPEPDVRVYGHRLTDRDVRHALRGDCDQALADYVEGRTPKAEAYDRARLFWLQHVQLLGRRPASW